MRVATGIRYPCRRCIRIGSGTMHNRLADRYGSCTHPLSGIDETLLPVDSNENVFDTMLFSGEWSDVMRVIRNAFFIPHA